MFNLSNPSNQALKREFFTFSCIFFAIIHAFCYLEAMERDFYQKILQWKASPLRKPLVIRGARQVGKTHLLKQFARAEYPDHIYLNFDEEPHFGSFFQENLDPDRIIKELSVFFKKKILPSNTLIIFDEIQECPQALGALKYFCEKKNEYHIATAGSLLGVKLTESFPVGKVNFLDLAPLSFYEFLCALGEEPLRLFLEEMAHPQAISDIFHNKLLTLLKYYFVIGGMPEVVDVYLKTESLEAVRKVQKEILDAYILDFTKHAPKNEVMKILAVWESVPNQLAKENKKFVISALHHSARGREYMTAIQWLANAGLILRSQRLTVPKLPMEAYAEKQAFKIFMLDVGLLGAMSKLDPRIVLEGDQLFQEFKGSLTENFVATELHDRYFNELYYWAHNGLAEVDFLVTAERQIFPLEVKAGVSKKKKSLLFYEEKFSNSDYPAPVLSRGSLRNFAHDGNVVNYPLYAIALFPRFR